MSKSRSFVSILIPSATVFISSFCIMVLELVASRLIARHLGSSLYTWTAVIGVVLTGITIGNYLGGRIADRFQAKKALAVLFAVSSVACILVVILNNMVGEWVWLWHFSWPARTFTHVSLVFLLPSVLLGTISPVVAKMALDQGLATGRTVGTIYAWGAAGSIAGTFAAGFYLIATMGTIAIIWMVGGVLLLMAILYWTRFWPLYVWAAVFAGALTMGMAPAEWAESTGCLLALREKPNPKILYQDESQYCYIAVKRLSEQPDKRAFMQDKLMHSEIIMGNILDLQYSYEQIHAAVTHLLSRDKNKLSVLVIGGGGYVFPRYVEKAWPGSRVDVAEIDPAVTEAAMQAFGLERDTTINTFAIDARNYINQLLEKKRKGEEIPQYDFIYEDALNDYSIPYQLTTKEVNDKIAQILTDSGAYMIELIDIYNSGLFLGATVNTLDKTFPYVYVISEDEPRSTRNTFVIIAVKREINLENLGSEEQTRNLDLWILSNSDMEELRQKARGMVLTDNYAPVENLLAPVVRRSAVELLSAKFRDQAQELKRQGKRDESIAKYQELIELDPRMSILAYNEIGMLRAQQGRLNEAVEALRKAIEYNEQTEFKINIASVHHNLGLLLKKLGQSEESGEHSRKAMEEFQRELTKNPKSLKTVIQFGNVLAETGDFNQATKYFQQAVDLNPYDIANHLTLSKALELQGRYDEAISALKKASGFMSHIGQKEDVAKLKKHLEFVEFRKSKQE